jgi:hypothetical protein
MSKKPGPKRKPGRPATIGKRAQATSRQKARRDRLRSYGLVPLEIWVIPGELDALKQDAWLRAYELDLMHAIEDGTPQEVLKARLALEEQRRKMNLPAMSEDDLVLGMVEGAAVRHLAPSVSPAALARPPAFQSNRGDTAVRAGYQPKGEVRDALPHWMLSSR